MAGLGEILRQARLSRGVSLDEAERATHIARRFLEALELEEYDVFSSPVFARGFLRNYSLYLGLDPADLLNYWPQSPGAAPAVESPPAETARNDFERRAQPLRDQARARTTPPRIANDQPGPLTRRLQPRVEPTPAGRIAVLGAALVAVLAALVFVIARVEGSSGSRAATGAPVTGAGAAPQPQATRQAPARAIGSMPNLVGTDLNSAVQQLQGKGITPLVIGVVSANRSDRPGTVISQAPAAGSSITTNSNVVLTEAVAAAGTTAPLAPAPATVTVPAGIRTRTATPSVR